MSGSKFDQPFGASSPKKIKYIEERTPTDFGFRNLSRVESDLLE